AQAVERAQEPAILLVAPADVAGSPPPARPQAVEAPVVADPEVRVALDVVASERAEPGPGVEERRPPGDHGGDRLPALRLGTLESGGEGIERPGRLLVEDRLGGPGRGQVDRLITHRCLRCVSIARAARARGVCASSDAS